MCTQFKTLLSTNNQISISTHRCKRKQLVMLINIAFHPRNNKFTLDLQHHLKRVSIQEVVLTMCLVPKRITEAVFIQEQLKRIGIAIIIE